MSCPGGCIGGAGQPIAHDWREARKRRTQGLYDADRTLQVHKPQDNFHVAQCYERNLGEPGGHKAHELLHTTYQKRRRIEGESLDLLSGGHIDKFEVNVCVGTSCHTRGSGNLLRYLLQHVQENGYQNYVDVKASFCFERCDRGPTVSIGGRIIEKCTIETARELLDSHVSALIAAHKTIPRDKPYPVEGDFERRTAATLAHFMQSKLNNQ
jgi:NADH-quinone oxidoreductase subunit G